MKLQGISNKGFQRLSQTQESLISEGSNEAYYELWSIVQELGSKYTEKDILRALQRVTKDVLGEGV